MRGDIYLISLLFMFRFADHDISVYFFDVIINNQTPSSTRIRMNIINKYFILFHFRFRDTLTLFGEVALYSTFLIVSINLMYPLKSLNTTHLNISIHT